MIDKKDLDSIFDIPVDGSHLDDESGSTDDVAFGSVVNQAGSAKEFKDQINSLTSDMNIVSKDENLIKEELKVKNTKSNNGGNENVIQNKKDTVSVHKDDDNASAKQRSSIEEVSSKSNGGLDGKLHNSDIPSKAKVDDEIEKTSVQEVIFYDNLSNDFKKWKLEDKDLAFIHFYSLKKNALSSWLLPGKEIDFDFINEELIDAKVDLSSISFGDYEAMFDALKHIQHWKDVVTEISLKVNSQYYTWKRAVDLFRGCLARIHYEKPSEKQEGVVMYHMGDMIMYFSKLEAVHSSVDAVSKNLDNAFDCISRQVTICLPNPSKDSDLVEKKTNKALLSDSNLSILQNADSILDGGGSKSRNMDSNPSASKVMGTVDWDKFS